MYKERIADLMKAVVNGDYESDDKKDDLQFIESRMNAFTGYVAHVAWMETRIQRLTIEGIDGQEWRDAVQSLDEGRRSKHEVAMSSINQLNRMSKACGLEPFYDGPVDDEHRNEVGDAIGAVVNEYFEGRYVGQLKMKDLMEDEDFEKAVELMGSEGDAIAK